ncbi:hypothetical protein HPB50_019416 [Hyalomma asiaticum]|uniref:Uncharacterized protein n=1 Tax=Hyalomma asiaticum TaxID=266040 RepID=A0ACB7RJP5_HYAAI|nr:hypothetical protein HPB50_019416 [Hyalomma asiaticum]
MADGTHPTDGATGMPAATRRRRGRGAAAAKQPDRAGYRAIACHKGCRANAQPLPPLSQIRISEHRPLMRRTMDRRFARCPPSRTPGWRQAKTSRTPKDEDLAAAMQEWTPPFRETPVTRQMTVNCREGRGHSPHNDRLVPATT